MGPDSRALPYDRLLQPTRLHTLSCPETRWITLTHGQMLQSAVTRSLQECSLAICIGDTPLFRLNAYAGRGSNSLRMDATVANSELFCGHEQQEGQNLLLEPGVIIPCAPMNLETEAKRAGFIIAAVVRREIIKYRGESFPLPTSSFRCPCQCARLWARMPKASSRLWRPDASASKIVHPFDEHARQKEIERRHTYAAAASPSCYSMHLLSTPDIISAGKWWDVWRLPNRSRNQRWRESHRERRPHDELRTMTGDPQCKRRGMTASAVLPDSSSIDEGEPSIVGMEDAASEDDPHANLVESGLSSCSQVYLLDWAPVAGAQGVRSTYLGVRLSRLTTAVCYQQIHIHK